MSGMTMQHDHEFGEINMVMHVHILLVPAVLNKELKLLIRYDLQSLDVLIMLL